MPTVATDSPAKEPPTEDLAAPETVVLEPKETSAAKPEESEENADTRQDLAIDDAATDTTPDVAVEDATAELPLEDATAVPAEDATVEDTAAQVPVEDATPAPNELSTALLELRSAVAATPYPLNLVSAEEARRLGTAMVAQLDDYLLPRLARLDAPLLVVVGGSTGAGKSTLVNSVVRTPVSSTGVLRPTTRAPLLVANPADLPWFRQGHLLPGLTRIGEPGTDPQTLQLVAAPALAAGLALLDAPDIDSVVDVNRALAVQLLAAADLWLFVTTAARYADAVPWEMLHTAQHRGAAIALVLDRVPAEAADEIAAHLAEMLAANGLGTAPLFVLAETEVDTQGLLPEEATRDLRDWLAKLAADADVRASVVRQTLEGAVSALKPTVDELAAAADDQVKAASTLRELALAAYLRGNQTVAQGVEDGRLLRGEVLARWQEFVGTGELMRTLEARIGRLRDRVVAAVTGRPAPGGALQSAIEHNLVTLIRGAAGDAAEQAYAGWQTHSAGAALLEPALNRPATDLPERAERLVRDWQRSLLELVRTEAAGKRTAARGAAYAVNATGLVVMIGVFASTAFIPTGAEVAVAGGTTVAAQKVLEAIFGDQAIRALAAKARIDLLRRVENLLAEEAGRYTERIASVDESAGAAEALRQAADFVERARAATALTGTRRGGALPKGPARPEVSA